MATEVEDLIQEQAMTNLNLEIMSENKEIFENLLLEALITNDLLTSNSSAISDLEKNVASSFKVLGSVLSNAPLENTQALLEDKTPSAITVLPPEINTNSTALVEGKPDVEVLPALDESTDTLEDISNTGDLSLTKLANINDGINALVGNAEEAESEIPGVAVDRQKEKDGDSSSLFEGFGGKAAALAGKAGIIGAAIAGTGLFVKGIFDGLTDEKLIKQITGKAADDLTASEQTFAALAQGIESLTFGLFSATEIFETVQPLADEFQSGVDALFDPIDGVFADFMQGFFKLLDGDIVEGFTSLLSGIGTFPSKLVGLTVDLIKDGTDLLIDLFAPDDMVDDLKSGVDAFFTPISDLFNEDLPNFMRSIVQSVISGFDTAISGVLQIFDGDILGGLSTIIVGVKDNFVDTFMSFFELGKSIFEGFIPTDIQDNITGAFDTAKESITNVFNDILDIPSKIAEIFTNFASDIGNFAGDKLKSIAGSLPFGGDTISALGDFFTSDDKRVENKPKLKPTGLFKAVVPKEEGINIPSVKSPSNVDAKPTAALSKERFNEQKVTVEAPAPQTIIIPAEKREKKTIERRKESSDMRLAMAGMGNL